ncbi:MAG: thioredoxin [Candidatus Aminicenantes bacterium 4484_214]|nr:MAG: thioredoxin [Candidatus Aminicenantes bacterium 4484_214]RLE10681.1 MAG: thioredoxin [Candidatus Aminicenantes bacterium]HDJ24068.1 thioredoxin [Candidatus Aminicenantes bacterium]
MANIPEVTDSTFQQEVLESDRPVLVDFWAPWCAPCRMVSPVVEAVAEKYKDKVKFFKMNTDENMQTAVKYQIMAIPSLIIFRGGKEAERIVGFRPQKDIEAILDNHLQKEDKSFLGKR